MGVILFALIAILSLLVLALPALAVFNMIPPMIYFIASMAVGMGFAILTIVILIFARGIIGPVLAARLTGRPLWIILGMTKRIVFELGEIHQKLFRSKHYGDFNIDPEAVYTLPNGINSSIGLTTRATNLNPYFVIAAREMEKSGISDIEHLEKIVKEAEKERKQAVLKSNPKDNLNFTLRLHAVLNYFKYNLNPMGMKAVIEKIVTKQLEGTRKLPAGLIIGVAILLICGAIAYTIISGQMQSQNLADKYATCVGQLEQCKTRVITPKTSAPVQQTGGPATQIG